FFERDRSDLFDHHRAGRERLPHAGSNAKAAANRGLRDRGPLSRQRGPGQASVAPDRVRAARICGGGNFFDGGRHRRSALPEALVFAASLALVPALVTATLCATGELRYAIRSYLQSSVGYVGEGI